MTEPRSVLAEALDISLSSCDVILRRLSERGYTIVASDRLHSPWRDMTPEQWDRGSAEARMTAMTAARDAAVTEADKLRAALLDIVELDSGDRWDGWREVRRIHDIANDALSRSGATEKGAG